MRSSSGATSTHLRPPPPSALRPARMLWPRCSCLALRPRGRLLADTALSAHHVHTRLRDADLDPRRLLVQRIPADGEGFRDALCAWLHRNPFPPIVDHRSVTYDHLRTIGAGVSGPATAAFTAGPQARKAEYRLRRSYNRNREDSRGATDWWGGAVRDVLADCEGRGVIV
eukprot:scaffold9451_cov103-Isochrysis_galbana.AAC.8